MVEFGDCKSVLVYGGTFDPPHRGHIELPLAVAREIGADRVLYVPAGRPPHKVGDRTGGEHRLAMLELATRGVEGVSICRFELDRAGVSYTVDTLRYLRGELGDEVELRLLIGSDMALIFDSWREWRVVEALAEPVVMLRGGLGVDDFFDKLGVGVLGGGVGGVGGEMELREIWRRRVVDVGVVDVSSSELRERLGKGDYECNVVREMILPDVVEYIRAHGLYL